MCKIVMSHEVRTHTYVLHFENLLLPAAKMHTAAVKNFHD